MTEHHSSSSILALDSGLGGLSILHTVKQRLPGVTCDYVADHGYFPYGNKTELQLEQRLERLLRPFEVEGNYSLVIIACNSASTAVLDYLRERFKVPFIGVVPAIKTAAQLTHNKRIGLVATQGTVDRSYTERLIADFAGDCSVLSIAAPDWVEIAEQRLQGRDVSQSQLTPIVDQLLAYELDTAVLGCTHFSWLIPELEQLAPNIRWVDSRDAIANRAEYLLSLPTELNRSMPGGARLLTTSESACHALRQSLSLPNLRFDEIGLLDV